ncbi:hypothetical protein WJX72_011820 [[Myrmecia] bisecta]|uniref:Uncharacterized protein n=1 Tax=[Myrmecia] bisecta TaxID=41462 RepID=A0AAW1R9J8_9CHLO
MDIQPGPHPVLATLHTEQRDTRLVTCYLQAKNLGSFQAVCKGLVEAFPDCFTEQELQETWAVELLNERISCDADLHRLWGRQRGARGQLPELEADSPLTLELRVCLNHIEPLKHAWLLSKGQPDFVCTLSETLQDMKHQLYGDQGCTTMLGFILPVRDFDPSRDVCRKLGLYVDLDHTLVFADLSPGLKHLQQRCNSETGDPQARAQVHVACDAIKTMAQIAGRRFVSEQQRPDWWMRAFSQKKAELEYVRTALEKLYRENVYHAPPSGRGSMTVDAQWGGKVQCRILCRNFADGIKDFLMDPDIDLAINLDRLYLKLHKAHVLVGNLQPDSSAADLQQLIDADADIQRLVPEVPLSVSKIAYSAIMMPDGRYGGHFATVTMAGELISDPPICKARVVTHASGGYAEAVCHLLDPHKQHLRKAHDDRENYFRLSCVPHDKQKDLGELMPRNPVVHVNKIILDDCPIWSHDYRTVWAEDDAAHVLHMPDYTPFVDHKHLHTTYRKLGHIHDMYCDQWRTFEFQLQQLNTASILDRDVCRQVYRPSTGPLILNANYDANKAASSPQVLQRPRAKPAF